MFCSCSGSWNCKGRRELPGKAVHIYEVVSSWSWRYFIKNKRGGRRESRKGWLISQLTGFLSSMGQRLHLKPAMEYSLAFFWTLSAVCLVPLVALKFSWTVHSFRNSAWSEEQCLKRHPQTVYISGSCSVDAPSEPQWCCQWISCAHIPVSFVISSACFLLIKLASLLSPEGGWQTDRHTRHRAGGQE